MTPDTFEQTLRANLAALENRSPAIHERLAALDHARITARLVRARRGGYTLTVEVGGSHKSVNSSYDPWSEAEKQLVQTLEDRLIGDGGTVHYFGAGLGYHLKSLLDTAAGHVNVRLYEKDADWLILAFSLHDFTAALESGELTPILDGVPGAPSGAAIGPGDMLWTHPVLAEIHAPYYDGLLGRLVSAEAVKTRALIVTFYPYMAYQKLTGAVAARLQERGCAVPRCAGSPKDIRRALFDHRPGLFFSMSFSADLARLAIETNTHYLCWEIDKIMNEDYVPARLSRNVHVFTTFEDDVARFTAAGADAHYLPAAPTLDPDTMAELTDAERKTFACDISFVGSPLIAVNNDFLELAANIERLMDQGDDALTAEGEKLIGAINQAVSRQEEFTAANTFRLLELIAEELDRASVREMFSFTPERLRNIAAKQCCGFQRLAFLRGLSPLCAHVYGAEDWKRVTDAHKRYKGPADFERDTWKIYKASKINLDITRIYALDGFSVRVFNVLMAGGFLMMNRTKPVGRSFAVGKELVVFDTPEELKELCEYYLHHPDERRKIAERGRARVLKDHMAVNRIDEMLERSGLTPGQDAGLLNDSRKPVT